MPTLGVSPISFGIASFKKFLMFLLRLSVESFSDKLIILHSAHYLPDVKLSYAFYAIK